jgi:hypothetical protein
MLRGGSGILAAFRCGELRLSLFALQSLSLFCPCFTQSAPQHLVEDVEGLGRGLSLLLEELLCEPGSVERAFFLDEIEVFLSKVTSQAMQSMWRHVSLPSCRERTF